MKWLCKLNSGSIFCTEPEFQEISDGIPSPLEFQIDYATLLQTP